MDAQVISIIFYNECVTFQVLWVDPKVHVIKKIFFTVFVDLKIVLDLVLSRKSRNAGFSEVQVTHTLARLMIA